MMCSSALDPVGAFAVIVEKLPSQVDGYVDIRCDGLLIILIMTRVNIQIVQKVTRK